MKRKTFAQAKLDLLRGLHDRGWVVTYTLKVNHARSPDGRVVLFFRPQAIYLAPMFGLNGTLSDAAKHAHSMWVDARTVTVAELIRASGYRSPSSSALRKRSTSWFSRQTLQARRDRSRRTRRDDPDMMLGAGWGPVETAQQREARKDRERAERHRRYYQSTQFQGEQGPGYDQRRPRRRAKKKRSK